jgi:hypothetical protein
VKLGAGNYKERAMNRLSMTTETEIEALCLPITRESAGDRPVIRATEWLSDFRVDLQQSLAAIRFASFSRTREVLSPIALEVGVIERGDLRFRKWLLETNGQTIPSH